ncbi:hypothetical protein Ais01nite_03470 [Asanoa ishikariensis]|uniref:Uncharacterized protein n=1 Tax=Asanoa ishikariensis TaxID=137265 RepID=A0A1H3TJA7_9ACTN|nr:hypothetical protein [Asanoa ishikariensis]GIF62312.1 hypothetical protein Ais01nite_03470 [Asanoa ishikariensis]SDZ50363.1 hypothetical protein SAMN05421684_5883 [Asanoa ishikariensis]
MTEEKAPESRRPVGLSIEPDHQHWRGLILKLGTSRLECNLALDYPDDAIGGGFLGPHFILDCWISELDRLSQGDGPVLLPLDFCDQCTAWLRVTLAGEGLVELEAGWSLVGQYSLTPQDLVRADRRIADFDPIPGAKVVQPLSELLAAIQAARATVDDLPPY